MKAVAETEMPIVGDVVTTALDYTRTELRLLNIDNVSLSFGDKLILRDVNAQVMDIECHDRAQGQVICFLGPSGIGKTQLSRIIAGLQKPTKGKVTLNGEVLTNKGAVGMVPQSYPLFNYATVAQNLAIAGKFSGLPDKGAARTKQYVEAFDLQRYLNMYPSELSGGTRQRVAIARQMVCAGHYLVLDEPYSGLDPIMKAQASKLILMASQLHTLNTIIIVTHDIREGLAVSDTVWLMGYEQGADGKFLPGATVVEQHDLAAMGFAWRTDLAEDLPFRQFVHEIINRFNTLR
jgi:ABC-type nitrate/sulfonate/bicarbonate transport system ATPase subunit